MATTKREQQAWGKRVTELMDAAGIGVDELVKRLNVNRSAVYHWRKGARIPSREMQPKLAKELGTSVAALNGWAA